MRQPLREVDELERAHQLCVRRGGRRVEVVAQAAGEEHRVLRDVRDRAAQRVQPESRQFERWGIKGCRDLWLVIQYRQCCPFTGEGVVITTFLILLGSDMVKNVVW